MKHLLTPEGEAALRRVLVSKPLLAFDFDGTLAPIVLKPADATIKPALAIQLTRLSTLAPVAIVTGRCVDDVTPRLGFKPHYIVGNHGAEDPLQPVSVDSNAALQALRLHLKANQVLLNEAGVTLEDKRFSMALHYRQAVDSALALATIGRLLLNLSPEIKIFGGKCVVNIVVAKAPDKGQAVQRLMQRAGVSTAVFIGDDLNDEAVFECAKASWLTVRIGFDNPNSLAHYFLDDPSQVEAFLGLMIDQLALGSANHQHQA
jgi:trehalose 6-phosphate phosphatase